jgi:hypothetical protein
MKRNLVYIAIVIIFFLALNFYFKVPEPRALQTCPENYPNTDIGLETKTRATNEWITDFHKRNPNASISEFAKERYKFYADNNCSATLQKYSEMKQTETETEEEKIIRETIQEKIHTQAMENMINAIKND